jgi:hypothetical protein
MAIDFDDDYEDFDDDDGDLDDDEHHDDDDGDLDDDEHHDDDDVEDLDDDEHHDSDEHHEDDEYMPPAPRRSTNPRSLSPVLSAKHRSGGLWPCGVRYCSCLGYEAPTEGDDCSCTHAYKLHLNGRY